ncbi:MAG: LuxR family transcriptional regulator, maltose regulon positive regulatory protein [Rhodospirillales bacterium]|nr:LuxR family transcriptional regulator, maltose regulon positive regulatory protein [Rhodospirillales bacterium]
MARRERPNAEPDWVIRSKLVQPPLGHAVIDRPRLSQSMLTMEPAPVTLLTAPPGYGKTTLAAQWADRLRLAGFTIAWLALDEDDDEPRSLLAYIAAALAEAGVAVKPMSHGAGQYGSSVKNSLATLFRAIEKDERKLLLVLEDVHRIRSDAALAVLSALLEWSPSHAHVCLTSRTRPALRLATLRARGQLALVDANDLRFNVEETAAYLGTLATDAVRALQTESEGWPVALQLARLHLERGAGVPASGRFAGRSSDLADYLAEQVLETLPPEPRDALLKASVLDRISAHLLDRLTGRNDGAAILESWRAANLFLTAVDAEQTWFRFHPLFAGFLRDRLDRSTPDAARALHAAAASWFAEHGLLLDAVRHAQAAGDATLVATILEEEGGWRAVLRNGPALLRVFRDLHPAIVARAPLLRLGQIFHMLQDSRVAEAQRAFDQLVDGAGGIDGASLQPFRRDLLMMDLLLRAHAAAPMRPEQVAQFERAIADAPNEEPAHAAFVELTALAQYWAGDFDRAFDLACHGIRICQRLDLGFIELYCHLFAAMARFERAGLDEAQRFVEQSASIMRRLCGADSERLLIADTFLAAIEWERGAPLPPARATAAYLDVIDDGESWIDLLRAAYGQAIAAADADILPSLLLRAERLSERPGLPALRVFTVAAALVRAVALGDKALAVRLAARPELLAALDGENADWRASTEAALGAIDWALARGAADEVASLLQRFEPPARARAQTRLTVRFTVQRCVLARMQGDEAAARAHLAASLQQAAPHGLLRPFLDQADRLAPLLGTLPAALLQTEKVASLVASLRAACGEGDDSLTLRLSPREREVLRLIAEGQTSKEAARQLGVSVNTVMTHRKSLYRKLDASTRARVIAAARAVGLVT